jgi:hypothetical protein
MPLGLKTPRASLLATALVLITAVATTILVRAGTTADEGLLVAQTNPFAEAQGEAGGDIPVVRAVERSVTLTTPALVRKTATFDAVASPAQPGARVYFQVREGSSWRTVVSSEQNAEGRARAAWRPPRPGIYAFRSAIASDATGDPAYSGPANVTVLAPGARVMRWRAWVEPGLEGSDEFVRILQQTFADPRGWGATGEVTFQYAPTGAVNLIAKLATPKTTDRLCYPADTRGKWSCHAGGAIVINSKRWFDGSPSLDIPVSEYRALVINHETGHALGFGHSGCGGRGSIAPVMMQQSKGLSGCVANPWPLRSELSRL